MAPFPAHLFHVLGHVLLAEVTIGLEYLKLSSQALEELGPGLGCLVKGDVGPHRGPRPHFSCWEHVKSQIDQFGPTNPLGLYLAGRRGSSSRGLLFDAGMPW